jgi:hypothetical protein
MSQAEQADVNDRVLAMKDLDLDEIIRILDIPERDGWAKQSRVSHRIQSYVPDSIRHIVYTRKWTDLTPAEKIEFGRDFTFGISDTQHEFCLKFRMSPVEVKAGERNIDVWQFMCPSSRR